MNGNKCVFYLYYFKKKNLRKKSIIERLKKYNSN